LRIDIGGEGFVNNMGVVKDKSEVKMKNKTFNMVNFIEFDCVDTTTPDTTPFRDFTIHFYFKLH